MVSVLVLTRYDRLGASSRVRFLQFLPGLAARGMTFSVRPFLDDDYVNGLYNGKRMQVGRVLAAYLRRLRALWCARRYDLVWMEKEALPWLPAAVERALMRGVPYVVDLDDAWFHRYDQSPSVIVRALMGHKIDAVMGRAAIVVAGNDYLADRARAANARRVETIPSVVDSNRYTPAVLSRTKTSNRASEIVIGWIGTPFTVRYLTSIEQAFRTIAAKYSVALHVVGASAPRSFARLPVQSISWNEATEIETICDFDIGIMPLDDTPWERGKCAYKLLQVMAAQIPVVASPVGANCVVVRDGINGFLADTTDEWIRALSALIDNPDLRAKMGFEALQTVKDHFTIERVLPQLTSILSEASALHGYHPPIYRLNGRGHR